MELDVFSLMTPEPAPKNNENTAHDGSDQLCNYLRLVQSQEQKLNLKKVQEILGDSSEKKEENKIRDPTALFLACELDNVSTDVIGLLLDAGFNVNACTDDNQSPLLIAIMCKSLPKVKFLLDRGADVKQVGFFGNPLHVAIKERNSIEMIEFLLQKGADVNQECRTNEYDSASTPLVLTIHSNYREAFEYLLNQDIQPLLLKPPSPNCYQNPPLPVAVSAYVVDYLYNLSEAYEEYIWKLLLAGFDVNARDSQNKTALTIALESSNIKIVELLLQRGAMANDVGPEEKDDIWFACEAEFPEILATLIERGGNAKKIYKNGLTALAAVLRTTHPDNVPYENMIEVIKILSEEGVDLNKPFEDDNGRPEVIPIARAPVLKVFKAMQSFGADLTLRVNGQNLLHQLIERGKVDMLQYVLSLNIIPVDETDNNGRTPLQLALQVYLDGSTIEKIVSLLLDHGANVNAVDVNNRPLLFDALILYDYQPALSMLKKGASVMHVDNNGENSLHIIARQAYQQYQQLFHSLLQFATPEQIRSLIAMKNNKGKTPADCVGSELSLGKTDFVVRQLRIGFRALITGDLMTAAKNGIDVLKFEKLYQVEIAKLTSGFYLEPFAQFDFHDNDYGANTLYGPITFLSQDLIVFIMTLLDTDSVVAFSSTCRQIKQWSNDRSLWRHLLTREYGHFDTCQNVKQEFAKRWNTQVNMRKGNYYIRYLSMDPSVVWSKYNPNANRTMIGYDDATNTILAAAPVNLAVFKDGILTQDFNYTTVNATEEQVRFIMKDHTIIKAENASLEVFNFNTKESHVLVHERFASLSVSGDLVACIRNDVVYIFNWKSRQELCSFKARHGNILLANNTLVVGSQATIQFYEIMHHYDKTIERHNYTSKLITENIDNRCVVPKLYLVNDRYIFAASDVPELIDLSTGKTVWRVSSIGPIQRVAIDDKVGLVATSTGSTVVIWSLHNGAKKGIFSVESPNSSFKPLINTMAFAGEILFVATHEGLIHAFRIKSNELAYIIITNGRCTSMVASGHQLILGIDNKFVAIVNFDVKL